MLIGVNILNAYEVKKSKNVSQTAVNRNNKEIEKLIYNDAQKTLKEEVIKNVMAENPELKDIKQFMNEIANSIKIDIKKIEYTSNDNATITYTIKMKDFDTDKINENLIAKRVEKRTGKSMEKLEQTMSEREIEKLIIEEGQKLAIEEMRKSNKYETFTDTVEVKRVNGNWE